MPVGAPSYKWTQNIEDEIFGRMMRGESVNDICGSGRDDRLPHQATFYRRIQDDAEFSAKYARAREVQAHHEADDIKIIADTATPESVNVARLQIDARKWRASKMAPKFYGDKVAIGGADDLPPIKTEDQGVAKLSQYLNAIAERS